MKEYKKQELSKINYIIIDLKSKALENLKSNNFSEAKMKLDKLCELAKEKRILEIELKK